MTQTVTDDNGEVHSFPDDASVDEMDKALSGYRAKQQRGPQAHGGDTVGHSVNAGVAQGLRLADQGYVKAINWGAGGLYKAITGKDGEDIPIPFQQDVAAAEAAHTGSNAFGVGKFIGKNAPVVLATMGLGSGLSAAAEGVPILGDLIGGTGTNALMRYGSAALRGVGAGGFAGALTTGGTDLTPGQGAKQGAAVGGVLGVGGEGLRDTGRAILGATDPMRADLANWAMDHGIPLRAAQVSDSPVLKGADTALRFVPGAGQGTRDAASEGAWTRELSKTFGEDSPQLSRQVLDRAQTRIGGYFDDLASRNSIDPNTQFTRTGLSGQPITGDLLDHLIDVQRTANSELTEAQAGPVNKQIDNIISKLGQTGQISGKTYQELTKSGSQLSTQIGNSDYGRYMKAIKDTLNDSFDANVSPADQQLLQTARTQYKNLSIAKDVALGAQPAGKVNPTDLTPALIQEHYPNYTTQGAGDIGKLSEVANNFFSHPEHGLSTNKLIAMDLAGGGAAGFASQLAHNPNALGIAAGTALGVPLAGRAAGSVLAIPALTDSVIDNSVNPLMRPALPSWLIPTAASYSNTSQGGSP